ncbi:1679_t:CDS:2, partial [Gigaspora rosea]
QEQRLFVKRTKTEYTLQQLEERNSLITKEAKSSKMANPVRSGDSIITIVEESSDKQQEIDEVNKQEVLSREDLIAMQSLETQRIGQENSQMIDE